MILKKYIIPAILAIILPLGMTSCFQDLGQDPPFDYPEQPKPTYTPKYSGEDFYMPFEGDYVEQIALGEALTIGAPGFDDAGKFGKAYKGAASSYLAYPVSGLTSEFSAVMWYKINATPDKAGILTIAADDPAQSDPTKKNNRTKGFRFFREGGATIQTFKLNVGYGTADSWFDGAAAASLDPTTTGAGWVFLAFTISKTECAVYINGQKVVSGAFAGVNWEGCTSMSIGSGAPYFTEWGHLSDNSLIDELRLFNKALTEQEVQNIMNSPQ